MQMHWYTRCMYHHQPSDYDCPFCRLVRGDDDPINDARFVVYADDTALAFVAPKWWVNNPGNVLVIPKRHFENIYEIPDDILGHVYVICKRVAVAMRRAYRCDGTSTRQHNEPGGGQDVWHFHTHVFPRFLGDNLYLDDRKSRYVTAEERLVYVEKLRSHLNGT